MPIKLIGRTTDFKGKPLWEILGNLKNFGVGRLVIRNRFQRYPEPCYMKILKVAGMPMPEEPYTDRKVMVLVERVFRGQKNPKPVQLDSATYKADYMLIPKDKEHLYLDNTKVPEMRILPKMTDLPPLFSQLVIRQMKAKGVVAPAEPKLNLRYNFYGRSVKNYRLVEEGETPTVELNFRVDESSVLFPKPEKTAAS
ncbi:small ribosomal subunit protein mS34 [Temnothorax longispinosus]|uniref:small ribosomal subunit protein mS34 n=1 Tax=Temnothorax longispinosus TaxID=300112 RepID=UPI003A99FEAB